MVPLGRYTLHLHCVSGLAVGAYHCVESCCEAELAGQFVVVARAVASRRGACEGTLRD